MIQTEPEDIEQIRARIRKMSDTELRKYGRAARDLSDPEEKLRLTESRVQDSVRQGEGGMAKAAS